ncbi:MAG: hypothetical protein JW726_19260 [Anaerolineales bacterium]|nr:hypothetical protein [Anaerolineales bacterium]
MNDTTPRPQHLFLVRFWSEAQNISPAHWRGSVEHVSSGQKIYFTSLSDLNDFMTLRLNASAQPTPLERK